MEWRCCLFTSRDTYKQTQNFRTSSRNQQRNNQTPVRLNNDRLSRNDQTQFIIKNAIKTNGVILYTKDGQYDLNNPTDNLFKSLLDGFAEYDNAIRAERTRLGKLNKVRNGGWYGAPPPYGYEIVDGKLAIHPEEGKTVKTIFKLFNYSISIAEIKRRLDKPIIFFNNKCKEM